MWEDRRNLQNGAADVCTYKVAFFAPYWLLYLKISARLPLEKILGAPLAARVDFSFSAGAIGRGNGRRIDRDMDAVIR